ncbi:hypothetical protein BX666DRAFT_746639 [Dichotomocladium elegans]|nr:hypothetical protein BX666DRAFT_746639 [Dichotomocladium elegans]
MPVDILFNTAPELHLITATELIRSSKDQSSDEERLKALKFLRYQAAAHQDIEAKTKLCTIYAAQDDAVQNVTPDEREVEMWSQSVFDKQLSEALASCAEYLVSNDTHPITTSTIDLILSGASSSSKENTHVNYLAGLLLIKGIGVSRDLEKGKALLELAAEAGCGEAAYELGRVCGDRYSFSLDDPPKSLHWYERAVALGETKAYVDLAYLSFNGQGEEGTDGRGTTTLSSSAALEYAKRGAEETKDRFCQYILGHLASTPEEAITWLTESAQQDFALAIEELASIYMKKQDYQEAMKWSTKGSDIPFCQTALGDMFRNGWGVARDYQRAFQYYQTAASQPEAPNHYAQYMLGEMQVPER